MLRVTRRWSAERRELFESVIVRPSMLAAILLLLWGHVVLLSFVWGILTTSLEEAFSRLTDRSADSTAAVLNVSLGALAVLFWALAGLGYVQRRSRNRDDRGA